MNGTCTFSNLGYITLTRLKKRLLEKRGLKAPSVEKLPTGRELVEFYLEPLAKLCEIKEHLPLNSKVLSISKKRLDKMKTETGVCSINLVSKSSSSSCSGE